MTKVLLMFGGESSEHEVSVVSAGNVFEAIDKQRFSVDLVFVSKAGRFFAVDEVKEYKSMAGLAELAVVLGQGKLISLDGKIELTPDVVFPIMHGENSEDGALPALCELLHIPVVGCDMYASALCMDKLAAKRVLEYSGIKTAPFLACKLGDDLSYEAAAKKLGQTLFVKPTKTGSSVGISKVHVQAEWQAALDLAFKYGDTVLVETAVPNAREIEVAVLGNSQVEAAKPGEIVPDREFYDYDSKYSDSSTSAVKIPADLPAATLAKIRQTAIEAYQILGCRGLARVDFLVSDQQTILNEINTMPGFTNISMYPKLWQAEGLSYRDLITKLIELSLDGKIST
jgi:D-alanine-D-alanine ligase